MGILKKVYEFLADGLEPHSGVYLTHVLEKKQKKVVRDYILMHSSEIRDYLSTQESEPNFWENFDVQMTKIAIKLGLTTGEVRRSFPKKMDEFEDIIKEKSLTCA